jgi:hypothetical protein
VVFLSVISIHQTEALILIKLATDVAIRGTKQVNIVIYFIFELIAAIYLFHLLRFFNPPVLSEELMFL